MRRLNRIAALLAVAVVAGALVSISAGTVTAPPAAADACTGDCGPAAFESHTETPPDPFYGEPVRFVARVEDDNFECVELLIACDPPTGNVEWYDGDAAAPFLTAPLHDAGSGNYWEGTSSTPDDGLVYAGLTGGLHTIKLKYVPGEHEPASDEFSFTVYPRATDTTVNATNAAVGQSVTISATVGFVGQIDEANGAQRPSGLVEFYDGGTSLGTAPVSNGVAQLNATFTSPGSHSLLARYVGDGNYDWSLSTAKEFTVSKGDTSIAVDRPAGPTVYGEQVTFMGTVVVTPPAAAFPPVPTGETTFAKDGVVLASANSYALGVTYYPALPLSVGSHNFGFAYSGDSNFNGSAAQFTHTVNKANTTTTVSATPNPSNVGQEVTLNATVAVVAPGAGTPTGAVQFLDGAAALGAPVALTGNAATLKIKALGGGSHSITARYLGDGNFNPSTSAPQVHTVRCDRVVSSYNGTYYVPASGSTCIANANVTGNVMVPAGATLSITNSTIGGQLMSTAGGGPLLVCGSSIPGITVSNSAAAVTIGSPYEAGCTGNVVSGNLQLSSNRAGVRFDGNRVGGTAQITGTSGGPTWIGGNQISGALQCSSNSPVASNGAHPNSVSGARTGECAGAAF